MVSRRWVQFVGTVGALANWTIPAAAMSNIASGRDPEKIDGKMTGALCVYSLFFMRWALAIEPANFPLLVCHVCNEGAQLVELGRWLTYKVSGKKLLTPTPTEKTSTQTPPPPMPPVKK